MTIPAATIRKARAFFEEVRDRPVPSESEVRLRVAEAEELAEKFTQRRKFKRDLPGESIEDGKEKKAQTYRESRDTIRPAVFERAGNRCEAWHPVPEKPGEWKRCEKKATTWDHWWSGTGRRRQKQSVATTWALCDADNFARTEKIPDIEFWNASFAKHCEANDLPVLAHIEHAEVPRKSR